jgi:DNA-binding transcriptional ArsR family regulator
MAGAPLVERTSYLERSATLVCSAVGSNSPDYDLADRFALTRPEQVKAIAHPLRTAILQLLTERAASVTELAAALERPKSTVAHHVDVLARNGLLHVVRTRQRRAIEERFYGRTARLFFVAPDAPAATTAERDFNDFEVAARESVPAYDAGKLWGFIRHARISERQAGEFWDRMAELVAEFDRLPREGETVYGFAVGIYPTDHPTLPTPE